MFIGCHEVTPLALESRSKKQPNYGLLTTLSVMCQKKKFGSNMQTMQAKKSVQ